MRRFSWEKIVWIYLIALSSVALMIDRTLFNIDIMFNNSTRIMGDKNTLSIWTI